MNLVFLMSLMVIVLSVLILVVGLVMGFRSSNNSELSSPFECGFDPMGSSRVGFSLRFFMILVLFVILDFETVLVIPSAIWLSEGMVSNWSLLGFVSFLTMLFLGIFFEMKEGVLQWKG